MYLALGLLIMLMVLIERSTKQVLSHARLCKGGGVAPADPIV